jgi:hypothetical protein
MACHGISCHVMSCHGMACHGMSWHVMACHGMSWHVMACHGMSWHVMACHGMSHYTYVQVTPNTSPPRLLSTVSPRWVGQWVTSKTSPCKYRHSVSYEQTIHNNSPRDHQAQTQCHRRMARGGHGLPKVSSRPALTYPSTPCGGPTPKTVLRLFLGWPAHRLGSLRRSSTLLNPTSYAYAQCRRCAGHPTCPSGLQAQPQDPISAIPSSPIETFRVRH